MPKFGLGQPVRRTEDPTLLTGRGRYTSDLDWPNQTHGVCVRSPYAHAKILSVDTDDAKAMPGVVDIITGADLEAVGIGPLPIHVPIKQTDGSDMLSPGHKPLALDRVRHVGDPVAFVVAETLDQARDAAEAVMVDYDDLPANVDTDLADAPDAPLVHDDVPENRAFTWDFGDEEGVADGLSSAAHTVHLKLINNRVVVNSMETRSCLAAYEGDEETGRYVIHTGTQGVHSLRQRMASSVFGIDKDRFRVITENVGGGFGMKIYVYPEQICALVCAKRIGRPVKWVGDRSFDAFTTDKHGRDHVSYITLGLNADYRMTALKVETKAAMGAYIDGFGAYIPTAAGAKMFAGVYTLPAIHLRVFGLYTNTTPVDAYRGAGRPEAAYLLERLVDYAALELGIDPIEMRRRNYIQPEQMPYKTPVGPTYDVGDFPRLTDIALARADYAGFEARKAASAAKGKLRGWGMAFYIECCGAGPGDEVDMRVDATGHVTVRIGTQDNGQGHITAYQQITSERLELPLDQITVLQGDTDSIATGGGTGGSRSIPEGGVGVSRAAEQVLEKAKSVAAGVLEAAAEDIGYADGRFDVVGTDKGVSFEEVAEAATDPTRLPPGIETGIESGLDTTLKHKAEVQTYPNGCHICEVEIDEETAELTVAKYVVVDDFGTVVNPLMLAGQVHGGIVQGLGQSLWEETVYDPDSGQLVSGSFMDYTMPRADNIPDIDFSVVDDIPSTTNPLGIKGAGEAGAIGSPPASINAIVDALKHLGVRHVDMPATQQKIWNILQDAKEADAAE